MMPIKPTILALSILASLGLASAGCAVVTEVDRELIQEDSGPRGSLGGYRGGEIFGWAQGADRGTTDVTIVIDGMPSVVTANLERPDLVEKDLSIDGLNGFRVEVGELAPGTEVAAFVGDFELAGSPIIVGN